MYEKAPFYSSGTDIRKNSTTYLGRVLLKSIILTTRKVRLTELIKLIIFNIISL